MTIKAGTTLTTAHLSHTTPGVRLSDDTLTDANTWEDWGEETITITDPGIAVEVTAAVIGRFRNTVDANTGCRARVGISLDGGSSFTYGPGPWSDVGTDIPKYAVAAGSHDESGTPSGDIVIKAQWLSQSTDSEVRNGHLRANMVPAG